LLIFFAITMLWIFFVKVKKKSNNKVLRILSLTKVFLICNFSRKLSFILLDIIDSIELDKTILSISTTLIRQ